MIFSKFLAVLTLSICVVTTVQAEEKKTDEQTTEHSYDEKHSEHTDMGMVLNEGKKWETDVHLRKGMQTINDAVKKGSSPLC